MEIQVNNCQKYNFLTKFRKKVHCTQFRFPLTAALPSWSTFYQVNWVINILHKDKWAAAWQNQRSDICAQRRLISAWTSTQSDQNLNCPRGSIESLATNRAPSEDWSDWVDVQADLSFRWAYMSFCWFCRASVQKPFINITHIFSKISDILSRCKFAHQKIR